MKRTRKTDDDLPGCFVLWFIFCLLLGLAITGLMVWGVVELIQYLRRH